MGSLTVVTAVLPARAQFLAQAASSVAAARQLGSAAGWQIRWSVTVDGPGDVPTVHPDHLVRLAARRGVSTARNAALIGADTDWALPLDADDILDLDGLPGLLGVLDTVGEDIGWVSANRLLMTGQRTPHWRDQPRRWQVGELAASWVAPFPFHPNSIIARAGLVLGCGGWPAVPANEDLALCLLLAEASAGLSVVEVLHRYRTWPDQEVAAASYGQDKQTAFALIEAVINAVRHRHARPAVTAPVPGPAYGRIPSSAPNLL